MIVRNKGPDYPEGRITQQTALINRFTFAHEGSCRYEDVVHIIANGCLYITLSNDGGLDFICRNYWL